MLHFKWCDTQTDEFMSLCLFKGSTELCIRNEGRVSFETVRDDYSGIFTLDIRKLVYCTTEYICCKACRIRYKTGKARYYTT